MPLRQAQAASHSHVCQKCSRDCSKQWQSACVGGNAKQTDGSISGVRGGGSSIRMSDASDGGGSGGGSGGGRGGGDDGGGRNLETVPTGPAHRFQPSAFVPG